MNEYRMYSDETYCTRDQLKRHFLPTDVDEVYKEISAYRIQFKEIINLTRIDNQPFYLCYVPGLVKKISDFNNVFLKAESMLKELTLLEKIYDNNQYQDIYKENKKKELGIIMTRYNINESKLIISKLIDEEVIGNKTLLQYYLNALNEIEFIGNDDTPMTAVYTILKAFNYSIRNKALKGRKNVNYVGAHYNYVPHDNDKIKIYLDRFAGFVGGENQEFAPIVFYSIILFFLIYIAPVEDNNYIVCTVLSNYFFGKYYESKAFYNLPIFTLLTEIKTTVEECYIASIETCDLTYFVNLIVNEFTILLKEKIANIKEYMDRISFQPNINKTSNFFPSMESEQIDSDVNTEITVPDLNLNSVSFSKEMARSNPFLKDHQCNFVAICHSYNSYYTYDDYMKETGKTFETARTSLNELASKYGLYLKTKVKKKDIFKFIYNKELSNV